MTSGQQKAIDKIRKLLRLGRRTGYEGERAAALAAAARIAAEAGVALDGVDADAESPRVTREEVRLARRSHARTLAHGILRYHFAVFVVGGRGSLLYFGPAVNIAIARHVETYLLREASREWAAYRAERRLRGRGLLERRRLWERGFFGEINAALYERPLRNDAEEARLAVEAYARSVCRITVKRHPRPRGRSRADLLAGACAGSRVNLSRPVEASAQARRIAYPEHAPGHGAGLVTESC